MPGWRVRDRFVDLQTRWFTLIGEHLETEQGEVLEYWRVERSHSVIVLPLLAGHLTLPEPSYRPGVGQATLDFPGGRLDQAHSLETAATKIVQRELAVPAAAIIALTPLNQDGWLVNSSFSNQRLYGFVAQLDATYPPQAAYVSFPANNMGVRALKNRLSCLQCRAVLQEWQDQVSATENA
jgi:hypothetical protein